MAKGRLILLVGQIASGKSTLARRFAEKGAVIVSEDSLVESLHAGNYKLYREDCKPVYKAAENAIVQAALTLGKTVVIDKTNLTRISRARFVGLARSLDCAAAAIEMPWDEPIKHAVRRFQSDSRGLTCETWLKVAKRKAAEYEPIEVREEGIGSLIQGDMHSMVKFEETAA